MPENSHVRSIEGDVHERKLSLAVEVRDFLTGNSLNKVVVAIDGLARATGPSPTGYYLFVGQDLPHDPFTVTVTGSERYFDAERSVFVRAEGRDQPADLSESTVVVTESSPALTVELAPTPSYDFSSETTVVRGFLRRPAPENPSWPETMPERAKRGIGGAELSIEGLTYDGLEYAVTSTSTGEFVLPLPLGGAIETRERVITEELDTLGEDGAPETRDASHSVVVVDGADPVLVVRYGALEPDEEDERVSTVLLEIEARTTNAIELELDDGAIRRVSPSG